jgi:membrane protein implicated in regulation of membrane protease activity
MIDTVCSALLLIGFLGLLVQTLLGVAHTGHSSDAGHHGGDVNLDVPHGGVLHAHAEHGPAEHGHSAGGRGVPGRGPSPLLALLSPMAFFSLCLGAGATGLLLRPLHLPPALVGAAALLGGLLLYAAVVRPLSGLLLRFASTPSAALEGALAREAEALTAFDAQGRGLVRLTVDGQIVRVLATLEAGESPAPIRPGERLTVTGVDGRTNSCRVARL